jgi:hypothetical protein
MSARARTTTRNVHRPMLPNATRRPFLTGASLCGGFLSMDA